MTADAGANEPAGTKARSARGIAMLVLAVAGSAISFYLLRVHWAVEHGEAAQGLCDVSATVSCAPAARSRFSTLFGVPVASLGIGYYAAVATLVLASWPRDARRAEAHQALRWLSAAGLAYSLFLAGVSAWVVRAFCPACGLLYLVNGGLAALAWRGQAERPDRWWQVATGWPAVAAVASGVAGVVLAQWVGVLNWGGAVVPPRPAAGKVAESAMQESMLPPAPRRGPGSAPLRVVLFTDFQCPYCRNFDETLEQARAAWGDRMSVEVRQFPLSFHANARGAALSALCADEQGRYWAVHDAQFGAQDRLDPDQLAAVVAAEGVDVERWKQCMGGDAVTRRLDAEQAWARQLGVGGTPSYLVNGELFAGAVGIEALHEVLRTAQARR